MKTIIKESSQIIKLFLFFWMALFAGQYLYFEALNVYVHKLVYLIGFFLVCAYLTYRQSVNDEAKRFKLGKASYDYLLVEVFLFILFAQYYFAASLIIFLLALALISSLQFIIKTKVRCKDKTRIKDRAKAISCMGLCILLIVPGAIGFYKENTYDSNMIDRWDEIKKSFQKVSYDKDDLFESHNDLFEELAKWDTLDLNQKKDAVRKIVLLEKEYLGIKTDFDFIFEKLGDYTLGAYINEGNTICFNTAHLNDLLDSIIMTSAHEVHHVYVNEIINSLDFTDQTIQDSYYYEQARAWKKNAESYIPSIIDHEQYTEQPIEKDASDYAKSRAEKYMSEINKLRKEKEEK